MPTFPTDHRKFIALLNSHEIKYVIVGGHAVAYHGHPRTTGDIDFLVENTEANARKLLVVLDDFGFDGLGLTVQDFSEPGTIIQLGFPPNRIDLVTSISGVSFEEAWTNKVTDQIDGLTVQLLDKQSLLANKAATGRLKDKADLDALK